jgi:hypothetical protein
MDENGAFLEMQVRRGKEEARVESRRMRGIGKFHVVLSCELHSHPDNQTVHTIPFRLRVSTIAYNTYEMVQPFHSAALLSKRGF